MNHADKPRRFAGFIGIFDYTVILTFVGLLITIWGMSQAMAGHFRLAIGALALSGLCDTFDGRIARTKKGRTTRERLYGIQLDSLCDGICFGIFPVMICVLLGVHGPLGALVIAVYAICGVTRLSWFNVLETEALYETEDAEHVYHGLPITSIAVILPLVFLLSFVLPVTAFEWTLTGMLLITGLLFVVDFRMRKPRLRVILGLIVLVGAAVLSILLFSRHPIEPLSDPEENVPLIDVITEDEEP